ncbi:MAG: methyltransferase domain-containing protein [Opitutaceae bacterium]
MSNLSLTLDTPDLARLYEQISVDRQFVAGKTLVEKLELTPGDRVLDIGCGTGLLAEHLADSVGPRGFVLGLDPLPHRIEIAHLRSRPNLKFQVGNAYDLGGFPGSDFNAIVLNAVFHWLPEKLAPLKQFHRLLKRRGRLGISTGDKDNVHALQRAKARVLARDPYARFPESKDGIAHHVTLGQLEELLTAAGFTWFRVERVARANLHADAEAAIRFSEASSFGNFLGHLPTELHAQARAEIAAELEQSRTPEGIRQDGARLQAIAFKI